MLRIEAVKKAKLEREQQEMLQKLKRDTAKKDTKKRDNVRELEKLWEEQEMKAAQEYSQAKVKSLFLIQSVMASCILCTSHPLLCQYATLNSNTIICRRLNV